MSAAVKFELLTALVLGIVILCAKPLGTYIADVMEGRPNLALRVGGRLERLLYRLCGVDSREEMGWAQYAIALLLFNVARRAHRLRLAAPAALAAAQPAEIGRRQPGLVVQHGHQLHHQHQLAGLFRRIDDGLPGADGGPRRAELSVRGDRSRRGHRADSRLRAAHGQDHRQLLGRHHARHACTCCCRCRRCSRSCWSSQGVIQNFDGYKDATTIEKLTYQNPKTDADGNPLKDAAGNPVTETVTTQTQTLPMGPVASQESIKELGTNGGGFLNANSAHPYENPTALSNLLEMLAILLIPFALTYTFGKMVGDTRQGWAVMIAMLVLFFGAWRHSPSTASSTAIRSIAKQGIDQVATPMQAGRQHGGQGDPLRHRRLGTVCGGHDRDLLRCGEHHARLDDAAGRLRAAVSDSARRTRARRRRHRDVHDSDLRHSRRIHRRPDDRPHAGVPRQEDRGQGNEAGIDLHPDDAVRGLDRHGGRAS